MRRDYTKLWERIVKKYKTQRRFAAEMGWSERTTSFKLNGHVDWRVGEILQACELLGIEGEEIMEYFF